MSTRRSFLRNTALAGVAGIVASRTAPAFAQQMGMVKIGRFKVEKCRPYGVWDDVPAVAVKM
jgi:hypothetical protein